MRCGGERGLLVCITVGVCVKRLAYKLLMHYYTYSYTVHEWKAAQAGLGRGKTVACVAYSAQDLPPSYRFRLLDDLGRPTTRSVR